MDPKRQSDGTILIPKRADGDEIIGDGFVTIGSDDPEFPAWDEWIKKQEDRTQGNGDARTG